MADKELTAWLDANMTPDVKADPRFPGSRGWSYVGPEQPEARGVRVARNTMRAVVYRNGRVHAWGTSNGRATGTGRTSCSAEEAMSVLPVILEEVKKTTISQP